MSGTTTAAVGCAGGRPGPVPTAGSSWSCCASACCWSPSTRPCCTWRCPPSPRNCGPARYDLLWIVDTYPLVCASLLILFGTLGDRVGRRRILLLGYALFGVASALAAFAGSAQVLIVARALLGVGGAMIMPATLSILRQVFPDRRERALAIGIWSAVAAVGAAVGPLLGGFLARTLLVGLGLPRQHPADAGQSARWDGCCCPSRAARRTVPGTWSAR